MTEPTHQKIERLKSQLQLTIVGQERLLNRLIVAIISGGHVLVEGLPGLAKTTAIKALAEAVAARFKRIQFTPDLLPGDITGTDVYEAKTGDFRFIEGPLFNDIVLADEINRAPAKVQSALLEAMQERQITAGGETRALSKIFLVMATQNPVEQSGTYRLPEAQLDRFMFQVLLTYPTEEQELEVLRRSQASLKSQNSVLSISDLLQLRDEAAAVHLSDAVAEYIVRLVRATREIERWLPSRAGTIDVGASPRAVLSMAAAAKAYALVCARDHVLPDDVQQLAPDVLRHRVSLSLQASVQKLRKDQLISELLKVVPSP
jgi:MoxR-like ATPase